MRLLTTNLTQEVGYAILRSLRERAEHIAVGFYGDRPADVARSSFADAAIPLARLPKEIAPEAKDLGPSNSAGEAQYVERLLEVCRAERIDTVLPTADNEVYVLSKNLDRLAEAGVRAPVPEWPAVLEAIDKHDVMVAAAAAGVPCPRSVPVATLEEARGLAAELGFPLVVKARYSFFGRGVRLVGDESQLRLAYEELSAGDGSAVIQEYIPGSREPSLTVFLDEDGDPQLTITLRKRRYAQMSYSTCIESVPPLPENAAYLDLLRRLKLRGVVAIQTKRDRRDGQHKLLEINLRLGANARILIPMALRRGFNPMALVLGAERSGAPLAYPSGDVGVSPLEDLLALRIYMRARRHRSRLPADNPPPRLGAFLRSYASSYAPGRTFDWFWWSARRDTRCVLQAYARSRGPLLAARPDLIPWG